MHGRLARLGICVLLLGLLAFPVLAADDEEGGFEGSVELVHRNVSVDGSQNKYDEDFDGLDSGGRLSNLDLHWTEMQSGMIDYAWIQASGLGGDPYERTHIRLGRNDKWEFRFNNTKQSYMYNLFELVPDEDGSQWNTQRRATDLKLSFFPTENFKLFFEYREGRRTGDAVAMKDIERELFLLDTPADLTLKRYTVGGDFRIGQVDLLVRQTLRRYDNQFNSTAEGSLGLTTDNGTMITDYLWRQNDSSGADVTEVTAHSPIGDRVDVTVGVYGTFFGDEELKSRVALDADGTSFTFTCTVSGVTCTTDADCDPVTFPGDRCDPTPFSVINGYTAIDTKAETTMYHLDVDVRAADPVTVQLQYRSLERKLSSNGSQDLAGMTCQATGEPCSTDAECDAVTPGDVCVYAPSSVNTSWDYTIDTLTGRVVVRPTKEVTFNVGYRTINRDVTRDGYNDTYRDADWKSDGDQTLLAGVVWRPMTMLRFSADYEDGSIDTPFTATAPYETTRARVRATIKPRDAMQVDVSYQDYENKNTAANFRVGLGDWNSHYEGETWAVAFSNRANENLDYRLQYSQNNIDSNTALNYDTAGFGGTEDGNSVYNNDYMQYSGQANYRFLERYNGYVRFWVTQADGNNTLTGVTSGIVNDQVIMQDYLDAEVGVRREFGRGMWLGGALRYFDYDDANNLLDYDGEIFSIFAGIRFR